MFDKFANKFLCVVAVLLMTLAGGARSAAPPAATAWEGAAAPSAVRTGEAFLLRVRVRNTGAALWEARGASRTVVSAMVVDGNGSPWPAPEARAPLVYPVPPGAATTCVLRITAPSTPGRYRVLLGRGQWKNGMLELDSGSLTVPLEITSR